MSCDHCYTHNGGMQFKGAVKMMALQKEVATALFGAKKAIVGGAGAAADLGRAWRWLSEPEDKIPKLKSSEFIAVTSNKEIFTSTNLSNWIKVDEPYYAIGTGSHYAMGAMATGKSSVRSVEIASVRDPHTGFGVTEYKLK